MSIHTFKTTFRGKAAELRIGWDRPLGYFHCVVTNEDFDPDWEGEDGEGDDMFFFSNLLEPGSFKFSLDDYEGILAALGIDFPKAMLEQSRLDQLHNAGNRITRFQADGTFVELSA